MKFGHLADCHIGGWRDGKLNELSLEYFREAVRICLEENVGFVLISGDLFDTALPGTELMKEVAAELNKLKEGNVDVYLVPGSHDFSPSGKTVVDVYEKAGLLINVAKMEDNKLEVFEDKTGVKIMGMWGKRGGLEKEDYKNLDKESLEKEEGFKIFLFHTALEEFKPKELEKVECASYADLPRNFKYYAGGHVHYLFDTEKVGYGKIVYPGPLFPNNFKEMEELRKGSFCIVDDELNLTRKFIELKQVLSFSIKGRSPREINEKIEKVMKVRKGDFSDKIITLRIEGELEEGRVSDVKIKEYVKRMEEEGAFFVMRNLNKLKVKAFAEVKLEGEVRDIEQELIKKHLGQFKIGNGKGDEEKLTKELMGALNEEKLEGETNAEFEVRMVNAVLKVLRLENE